MIDYFIFGTFLTANLAIGLYHGRNVRTLRDYALGTGSFSNLVLAATIAATWLTGSGFSIYLTNIFNIGIQDILFAIGTVCTLMAVGNLSIRMGEFKGSLSLAEGMGRIYGQRVRMITAISGILFCLGIIAAQFRIGAQILSLCFGTNSSWSLWVVATVVTLYSILGGFDSVALTDLFQFALMALFMPIILWVVRNSFDTPILPHLAKLKHFSFSHLWNDKKEFLICSSHLGYALFVGFSPAIMQRFLLSPRVLKTKKSFALGTLLYVYVLVGIVALSILMVVKYQRTVTKDVLPFLIQECVSPGLKGLAAVGIMAMMMSTADSYINTASVLFANDILQRKKNDSGLLPAARWFGVLLGVLSVCLVLSSADLLSLIYLSAAFYIPIVITPLLLSIAGFRTSERVVFLGMLVGSVTAIGIKGAFKDFNVAVPGMFANLVAMLSAHYLLDEPGGWVGIKVKAPLIAERQAGMRRWENVKAKWSRFDLYIYLTKQLPSNEGIYTLIGLWVLGPVFFAHITLPKQHHIFTYLYQYPLLTLNTLLLTYPIWFAEIKSKRFMAFFYPFTLCYALCVAPAMLWIVSGHNPAYATLFLANLCLLALLLPWPVVIGMAWVGPVVASLVLSYTCPEAIASVAYPVPYLQLICGVGVLVTLFYYTTRAQRKASRYYNLAHHYNTITKAMHKLRTTPERFMQQLQDKTHGLDTAVEMSKALQEALKQQPDNQPLAKAATQLTTHIKDSSGYLSKLLALVQNGGLLQRKNMALRDFTHQLLNSIARNPQLTTELIIANQSSCKHINWDIDKIHQLLLEGHKQLQSKHPNTDYFFLHIQDTKLTYPNYPNGLPAIAFTLTTGEAAPELEAAYLPPDKAARLTTTPYQSQAQQCIYAHYGYIDMQKIPKSYLFVLPASLKKIRPESITDTPVQTFSPAMLRKAKVMEAEFWTTVGKKEYDIPTLEKAVAFMKEAHAHQQRKSGEPYYTHPLTVAQYASQHSDSQDVLIAALLHDTIEDTDVTPEALKLNFGKRVSTLVQHLSHIQNAFKKYKLSDAQTHTKLEKASGDKEAVLIKLCDRLHNMRTLGAMPKAKRLPKAQETLNVYIPMAKKVGYTNLAKELTRLCKQVV